MSLNPPPLISTVIPLTAQIVFALALAKDKRATVLEIAPLIAYAIRSLPIQDFKISFLHKDGYTSPEYTFGKTKHSIHKSSSTKITTDGIEGSLLNRGKLTDLARATWFGYSLIPGIWLYNSDFRADLANSEKHLAAVQEVLWLGGFWDTTLDRETLIITRYQMPGGKGDIDWRFRCRVAGLVRWINLEVKRRDGDIKALLAGGKVVFDPFTDIAKKFGPSDEDEINVAGVTVYGSDLEMVKQKALDWLKLSENQNVDCLAIWNDNTKEIETVALDTKLAKLEDLRALIDPPIPDGTGVPIGIWHPIEVPGVPRIQPE